MSTEKKDEGTGPVDIKDAVRKAVNESPFYKHIGMRLVGYTEDGKSKVEIMIGRDHMNIWSTAHGGVLASLLDSACGLSLAPFMEGNETAVTQDLHVKYTAPLRAGRVTAYGRVVHKGRGVIMTEAEAFDENGSLVGIGSATHRVRKNREE